jgi:NAD-dependent deacetylase
LALSVAAVSRPDRPLPALAQTGDDQRMDAQALAAALAEKERIVWLTGAGISVASGIRPYRKSNDAIWNEFVLEWGTFRRMQEEPISWWKDYWIKAKVGTLENKAPNAGHHALVRMLAHDPRQLMITQNIDGLLAAAGIDEERTIEVHGRYGVFRCVDSWCKGFEETTTAIDFSGLDRGEPPRCAICNDLLRPVVLLFDEAYYSHPWYQGRRAFKALEQADAILCAGTSFSVGVTAAAMAAAHHTGALMVNLNVDPPDFDDDGRIVSVLGPCEETLPALAEALGAG